MTISPQFLLPLDQSAERKRRAQAQSGKALVVCRHIESEIWLYVVAGMASPAPPMCRGRRSRNWTCCPTSSSSTCSSHPSPPACWSAKRMSKLLWYASWAFSHKVPIKLLHFEFSIVVFWNGIFDVCLIVGREWEAREVHGMLRSLGRLIKHWLSCIYWIHLCHLQEVWQQQVCPKFDGHPQAWEGSCRCRLLFVWQCHHDGSFDRGRCEWFHAGSGKSICINEMLVQLLTFIEIWV